MHIFREHRLPILYKEPKHFLIILSHITSNIGIHFLYEYRTLVVHSYSKISTKSIHKTKI